MTAEKSIPSLCTSHARCTDLLNNKNCGDSQPLRQIITSSLTQHHSIVSVSSGPAVMDVSSTAMIHSSPILAFAHINQRHQKFEIRASILVSVFAERVLLKSKMKRVNF